MENMMPFIKIRSRYLLKSNHLSQTTEWRITIHGPEDL